MKKLNFLLVLLFVFAFTGCKYDDEPIWNEVHNLQSELSTLNKNVDALQKIVEAQQKNKSVTAVEETETGYVIAFNDGTKVTITNGKDAPAVGTQKYEGEYYWTLGGEGKWILDESGKKIPVAGKDGASPQLSIDNKGYWMLNGKRLTDEKGEEVKAVGKDGDSFFKEVKEDEANQQVIFILTDGKTITLPKEGKGELYFEAPEDGKDFYSFSFNETKELKLNMSELSSIELFKGLKGWKIKIRKEENKVVITSPKYKEEDYQPNGIISFIAIDKKRQTKFISASVEVSIGFTDKDGTFVVCEGNMTTVNGTVAFYDKNGNEYLNIFEEANDGKEIGNVVQDMYMANGRIYFLTQNGSNMQGMGRFVVCDAKTMKMIYASELPTLTAEKKNAWPQHLVIVSPTKGFVQYSEAGMEATSGIATIEMTDNSAKIGKYVEGTFGQFTVKGATKTRMVYSRGKIYAACGNSVVIINPDDNTVEKRLTYENRQVKGIVKGNDGNIYYALTGKFTGNPNMGAQFDSKEGAQIVSMTPEGTEIERVNTPKEIIFPTETWSPSINMCASLTQPYLYFVDNNQWGAKTASRYNIETKKFDVHYVTTDITIYGIMGEHPTTHKLWVGTSDFISSKINVFDTSATPAKELKKFSYPTQKGASPAGIDFTYRFSEEYINK